MSDATQLRRVVDGSGLVRPRRPDASCDCGREQQPHDWDERCIQHEADLAADRDRSPESLQALPIVTLARHADELIRLLKTCERFHGLSCDLQCNGWYHTTACHDQRSLAEASIRDAVAAIHAVDPKGSNRA